MSISDYNVLLVEDDEDHAVLIAKQLSRIDMVGRVIHAVNGHEAIELLSDRSFRPQLVLLDLNLPQFSGHEVLESIRSADANFDIPVVVVTSSTNDDDAVRALKHDVVEVLVKPVTRDRLVTAIRKTVRGDGEQSNDERRMDP